MSSTTTHHAHLRLADLPEEILIAILGFLSVPDLLQCGRACHQLRSLAIDPVLHHQRLLRVYSSLESALARRKTKAAVSPPNAWIWLTKTNALSRSINRSLIRIRLSHSIESRPSSRELVLRAILPQYATNISPLLVQLQGNVVKNQLKNGLCKRLDRRPNIGSLVSLNIIPEECAHGKISPAILDVRRKVIKEGLKDGLRAWVGNRGLQAQHKRALELDEIEKTTVRALVQRLTARRLAEELERRADAVSMEKKRAQERWGRALEAQKHKEERRMKIDGLGCAHPTRAHVAGLRRFFEGIVRAASV